jgi:hypothetical protein
MRVAPLKNDVLQIRCSRETRRAFKTFTSRWGFKSYEEALTFLLGKAEELKWTPVREKGRTF